MFDCDRGKDGVHDKRTGGLALAHEATQNIPMPLARLENTGTGLSEPSRDRRAGLRDGKRSLEDARVAGDPQERPQR
jgi:hypothetical protein